MAEYSEDEIRDILANNNATAAALAAYAMRPQKAHTYTTTYGGETPYALDDMIATRRRIGQASRALDEALKIRESTPYSLASALANIPQQQGAGSWLSDFARAFGGGMAGPMNMRADRAQKAYENEMKDLEMILDYDKAMGKNTVQTQEQNIDYDEMPWGGAGGGKGQQQQQPFPMATQPDWDYWIKNWDKDRPTEAAYRANSELGRAWQNWQVRRGLGDKSEMPARDDLRVFIDKNYLPMARSVLKGSGPITDFEDKKYTRWLSEVYDPIQLKDVTIRMIADIGSQNGWTDDMKHNAANMLGALSDEKDLLKDQATQLPWRVRGYQPQQMPVQQMAPQQDAGWQTTKSGIRFRKI